MPPPPQHAVLCCLYLHVFGHYMSSLRNDITLLLELKSLFLLFFNTQSHDFTSVWLDLSTTLSAEVIASSSEAFLLLYLNYSLTYLSLYLETIRSQKSRTELQHLEQKVVGQLDNHLEFSPYFTPHPK